MSIGLLAGPLCSLPKYMALLPLPFPAPADLPACPALGEQSTALLGSALLLSHLLCRALAERPFAASDAPAWFEATARMARAKLAQAAAGAPKDSLQLPAALLAAVLGSGNPVAEVRGAVLTHWGLVRCKRGTPCGCLARRSHRGLAPSCLPISRPVPCCCCCCAGAAAAGGGQPVGAGQEGSGGAGAAGGG